MTAWLVLLLALTLASAAPALAQLGPKEGRELSPTDLDRVALGTAAPDFTLEGIDGKPITLSAFRGKKNVVLVFYRGRW